jgi:hypothetical protein
VLIVIGQGRENSQCARQSVADFSLFQYSTFERLASACDPRAAVPSRPSFVRLGYESHSKLALGEQEELV